LSSTYRIGKRGGDGFNSDSHDRGRRRGVKSRCWLTTREEFFGFGGEGGKGESLSSFERSKEKGGKKKKGEKRGLNAPTG